MNWNHMSDLILKWHINYDVHISIYYFQCQIWYKFCKSRGVLKRQLNLHQIFCIGQHTSEALFAVFVSCFLKGGVGLKTLAFLCKKRAIIMSISGLGFVYQY